MEDGQIETFDSKIHKMKDYEKTAEKNKTQRANKADKKKDAAKELQRLKKENKMLTANLAQSRMPFVADKRGEEEIDAESVQLWTTGATPRKQRFAAPVDKQRAGAAFRATLEDGLGFNWDRLGETRSHRELKVNFIDKNSNHSGNKRPREEQQQPIVEEEGGEWHYAEEEDELGFIDAEAAEVRHGSMDEDEDRDVYAHSA